MNENCKAANSLFERLFGERELLPSAWTLKFWGLTQEDIEFENNKWYPKKSPSGDLAKSSHSEPLMPQ